MSLTSGMPLLPVPLTNRTRFCLSQTAPLGPRLPKIPFIFQDGSGPQSDQPSRVTTPPSEYHILWAGGRARPESCAQSCGVWWAGAALFKLPWSEQSKRDASPKESWRIGSWTGERRLCPLLPLAPSHWALFFLQALDVWAMGVTLYCFVFGQVRWGVLCPGYCGWLPWTNSYPCREVVLTHLKVILFPQLDLNMKKYAFPNIHSCT